MDKPEHTFTAENNTKNKGARSKLTALRRGLRIDKKDKKPEKEEKLQKPNKTYSLIKKLKLGKSVSNPILASHHSYLSTEIVSEAPEKTPSMSSVSTDAASTSANAPLPESDMSDRPDTETATQPEDRALTYTSDQTPADHQPPPDEEEDSYESFHESENAHQSDDDRASAAALSADKDGARTVETSDAAGVNASAKPTADMPAFSDLIFDKQQENAQTVKLFHINIYILRALSHLCIQIVMLSVNFFFSYLIISICTW